MTRKDYQKTDTMNEALRAELVRLGWDPESVIWGRRVWGNPEGVELERHGNLKYYAGPFWSIKKDGQMAIVRSLRF
jgi:hypothetical protein